MCTTKFARKACVFIRAIILGGSMNAKILIVDDELAIRNLITKYLQTAGYECHTAENAASAKEILASNTIDLLLTDIKMPGESGLDLIRYAKKHYPELLA